MITGAGFFCINFHIKSFPQQELISGLVDWLIGAGYGLRVTSYELWGAGGGRVVGGGAFDTSTSSV